MARTAATITMSMREVDRVKTVQAVVDRMLPVGLAAKRLGLSRRQLERLLLKYKAHGAAGLVSAKRGHPSNHQLAPGAAERALRTGQSIHVRRDGDRRSPSLQPIESTERLPPPCRSDDLTTVGVCVACATPPVDKSAPRLTRPPDTTFLLGR